MKTDTSRSTENQDNPVVLPDPDKQIARLHTHSQRLINTLAQWEEDDGGTHLLTIANGRNRTMTRSELNDALRIDRYDLVLNLITRQLWGYLFINSKKRPECPSWYTGLDQGPLRVLYTGMKQPDRPFGLNRLAEIEPGDGDYKRNTFRSHISSTAMLIQGGESKSGTGFLIRTRVDRDISTTGHGYFFNPSHRYLVIEDEA